MIRTGEQYRESIRDGREVYVDGVRVEDVTTHPAIKPSVDNRARIYDMQHEKATVHLVHRKARTHTLRRCPAHDGLGLHNVSLNANKSQLARRLWFGARLSLPKKKPTWPGEQ